VKIKPYLVVCALVASTGMTACDQITHTVDVDLPAKMDFSDGFQQSDADAIIRECGADGVELTVEQSGEVIFMPGPNSDYEASACVLNYIKESGTTKFGFVGNEKYRTPEEGQ